MPDVDPDAEPLTGSGSTTLAADGAIGLAEPLDRHAVPTPVAAPTPVSAEAAAPSRVGRGLTAAVRG